jgi:hypothetical protein
MKQQKSKLMLFYVASSLILETIFNTDSQPGVQFKGGMQNYRQLKRRLHIWVKCLIWVFAKGVQFLFGVMQTGAILILI